MYTISHHIPYVVSIVFTFPFGENIWNLSFPFSKTSPQVIERVAWIWGIAFAFVIPQVPAHCCRNEDVFAVYVFCSQDFDIWWKFPSNVENIKWSSSAKFSTFRNMPKKNLQIAFVKCICEFAMVVFLMTIPPPNRWRSEFENVLRFLFWSEVFTSTASSLFVFHRFSTSLLCLQWRFFFFTSSRFAIILIARKTKNLSLENKGVAHGWTRGFSFPGVSWPWLCAGAHVDR